MEVSNSFLSSFGDTTSSTTTTTSDSGSGLSSDFETFLRMLTTQLENQDPLDPVKSEDFAVQLATFSGVEQQVLTNDLLQDLVGQMSVSGMAEFAGWVGMEARAQAPAFYDGSPLTIVPNPELAADSVQLVVYNDLGEEVQRVAIDTSSEPIEWLGYVDGEPLPSRAYSFTVESYSDGGLIASEQAEVYTTISEVRQINGETMLVTRAGYELTSDMVTALRQPGA